MTDMTMLGHAVELAVEPPDDEGLQWIELMPTADKVRNGDQYFTVDEADLGTFADYIGANASRIPIDYDHGGGRRLLGGGNSSRAAGWLTGGAEVRPTDDGPRLYAQVKWTPKALQEIRDGEYRFISPEIEFAKRDSSSGLLSKGKAVLAGTLTNRPFFKQLASITADDLNDDQRAELEVYYGPAFVQLLEGELVLNEAQQDALNEVLAAVWSTSYINDLPDSSFLYVAPGGKKDADGKTMPRSLRYFPVKDSSGTVDLPHLRNAIARAPQADLPDAVKSSVQSRARNMLDRMQAAASVAEDEPDAPAADDTPADDTPDDSPAVPDEGADDKPADDSVPAPDDTKEEADMADLTTEVLTALGVPEHADEPTILAAIQAKDDELKERDEKIAELSATSDEAVALATRVQELEKQARKREVAIVLAEEVRTGRVAAVEVESLSKHFENDIDSLKELVNARPIGMFAHVVEAGAGGDGHEDAGLKALAEEFRASDPLDPKSASLHNDAMKILAERGKSDGYTADDYLSALDEASKVTA